MIDLTGMAQGSIPAASTKYPKPGFSGLFYAEKFDSAELIIR
jgi:hypothetical protein